MEAFISGPTRSGKTVFGVGLYEFLSGEAKIKNKVLSLDNKKVPTLDELYLYIKKKCEYPPATDEDELRIYIFEKESLLGDNVRIEFLDYRGEHLPSLPDLIRNYNEFLSSVEPYFDDEYIEKIKMKNLSFEDLKKLRSLVSVDLYLDIVRVYLICRFFMSNKLMLLIDGEKLLNYLNNADSDIIEDLITYKDIVYQVIEETKNQEAYPEKEIALVITKADLLDELFEKETGKNRIENEKKFIKWIDKYLTKSDKKIPAYIELRKMSDELFATSVKIISSEKRVITSGFEKVRDWLESVSLLGGKLL